MFNPATAGIRDNPRVNGGYRNQWPAIGKSFVSYYASYDQYVEKVAGGTGALVSRDVQGQGVFSETRMNLIYSYPVTVTRHLNVNLGFQAGVSQKNINASGLTLPSDNPYTTTGTEVLTNQSSIYPDFAVGGNFKYLEQYELNFTVDHLNIIQGKSSGTNYFYMLPARFTFQISSHYPSKIPVKQKIAVFRPGFMTQIQQSYIYLNYGCNIGYAPFIAGLWVRNDLKFKINTFIFII